ncbi:hypothetical protein V6N13_073001 [Hibiscus sabdariffa]
MLQQSEKEKSNNLNFVGRKEDESMNLMGVAVDSEEAAYNLYKDYGHRMGFSVQRGRNMYVSGTNVIRCKDYFCSKEGFKEFEGDINVKQYNKLETRTGCQTMIRFTMEDNIWTVTRFISEHNHELATPSKRHLLRSARSLLTAKANVIGSMVSAEFHSLFHRCMQGCESEIEFEETWTKMMNDYKLHDYRWLKGLYKCREKWSTAFSIDIFSSQVKSSQRAEVTNNVLHGISKATTSLTEFILEFENLVARWRSSEAAKKNVHVDKIGEFSQQHTTEVDIESVFRNRMVRFAYDFIVKSQANEKTRELCQKILYEGNLKVEEELTNLCDTKTCELRKDKTKASKVTTQTRNVRRSLIEELPKNDDEIKGCANNNSHISDPPCVRPKGISNARLKCHLEKRKSKASTSTKQSKTLLSFV